MKIDPAAQELSIKLPDVSEPSAGSNATSGVGETGFGELLARGIADASRLSNEASAKTEAVARGTSDDLHGTMITVKEADISMKLVGSVRNRLLDAFHELWRINL
jgi:flagellar hook-basal body complex protein FliE